MDREYKGFAIRKNGSKWEIWSYGMCHRTCNTLKECKARIDSQSV